MSPVTWLSPAFIVIAENQTNRPCVILRQTESSCSLTRGPLFGKSILVGKKMR